MKICITGKPCCGKSTAMMYIKEAGYKTFIADEYVHQIYKANQPGYLAIKKAFGSKFVTKNEVNRSALGKYVFSHKNGLKKLNKIMNPIIKFAIEKLPKNETWFVELGTYIFYPQDFANIFDKIVLIFTTKNWKNIHQTQKFNYLKKIPTIFVDNIWKTNSSILNIDKKMGHQPSINVDIFVNNSENKKIFRNDVLKICNKLNQHIIK